jgi:protein O-GlcNAc transferase
MNKTLEAQKIHLAAQLKAQGRVREALGVYRELVQMSPMEVVHWYNLANTCKSQGDIENAKEAYQNAIKIKPDLAEAHFNLANVYAAEKKITAALTHYEVVTQLWPHFALGFSGLARMHEARGDYEKSIELHRRALTLAPDDARILTAMGNAFESAGMHREAEIAQRRAIEKDPGHAEAYANLGLTLAKLNQFNESLRMRQLAIDIAPDNADMHLAMAHSFGLMRQFDKVTDSLQRALELKPHFPVAASNLLFNLAYATETNAIDYLAIAGKCQGNWTPISLVEKVNFKRWPVGEGEARRLKVAYMSGDFRDHSVANFIREILIHHDRVRLELHGYSTCRQQDSETEKIKAQFATWLDASTLSDSELCERIRRDQIDVLVDLSGHTEHNRMSVIAMRAAPVQVHYLGYFASTAVIGMDYWVGDDILVPSSADNHFTEKIWRLPRTWTSYAGRVDAPLPLVRQLDETIWLGSFNQIGKLTPRTLQLWAKIMRALPASKLFLKTMTLADPVNRQRIEDEMRNLEISSDRLKLIGGGMTWNEHMAMYNDMDIALDPVGAVGGGTTTCDALWMGLPVITLAGDRMNQRMSASMLHAIGHLEWVTSSEDDYVEAVAALARDLSLRVKLKATLRSEMQRSPLCDAKGLARNLEDAYYGMYANYLRSNSVDNGSSQP